MAWPVVLLMSASCLGWGAMLLRLAGVGNALIWRDRTVWSFGLGMGMIGWFGFFAAVAGRVEPATFALICAAGLPGLWDLRRMEIAAEPITGWTWMLLALTVAVLAGDLIEGLAPPTDADSLAYHFAIPRRILLDRHLVFVPRAADGAIPLLLQMTYLTALALGGEQAMTLWCTVSGWAAVAITYGLGRSVLGRDWALAAALAMATLPATLYGAGSGQVEVRLAVFTAIGVMAILRACEDGDRAASLGWACVAGLAVGFACASKYPALIVAVLCGLILLARRRGVGLALAYTGATLVAGLQWYGWNWWNTGDPLFPVLYGVLPYRPGVAWDAAHDALFREWGRRIEAPLPRGLPDFLSYPLLITFNPPDAVDGGRTGLGVLPILLAPFAGLGAWRHRRRPNARRWLMVGLVGLGFYVIWFLFGASQRVRHYLPFMPLIIVGLMAAAERGVSARKGGRRALAAGVAAVLLLQSAGEVVFLRNFAQRLIQGESRQAFIDRNVAMAFAVDWINANLPASAKVATHIRQWLYLLNSQTFYADSTNQAEIDVRFENKDARRFWHQMRALGITHALLPLADPVTIATGGDGGGFYGLLGQGVAVGCGHVITVLSGPGARTSRTLGGTTAATVSVVVLAVTPETCPLALP